MHRIALHAAVALAVMSLPASAAGRTIPVRPGQSLQAGVDKARPGDRVVVAPGVYRERGRRCPAQPQRRCAVVITRNRIRLVARSAVVVARSGRPDGIAVGKRGSTPCLTRRSTRVRGTIVAGFTLVGFRSGVSVTCADRFRVTRMRVLRSRRHGVSVRLSRSGRVHRSLTRRAGRSGIHVRESDQIRIDHNTATRALTGVGIENSSDVRADHNFTTRNSAGILSLALPRRSLKSNDSIRVDHNRVGRNNRRNTCAGGSEAVCRLPRGVGIAVLAGDRNRLDANRVRRHGALGITVTSFCGGLGLPLSRCSALDVEPHPDGNLTASNLVVGSTVDLAWDQTGSGNCWRDNIARRSSPSTLPDCVPRPVAPIQVGIGEQATSAFGDPLFAELGLKRARVIVPWNLTDSPDELRFVGEWLESARIAGVEPLVHFTATTGSRCPDEPCRLPSVDEYAAAFRAFRDRFPSVLTLGVWNEANHPSQPTYAHPDVAAGYYRAARAACPECRLVAADVLDGSNMGSWINAFKRHAGEVEIWGLHNYRDANVLPGQRSGGTGRLLSITSGQVWLTETGGIVKFVTPSGMTRLPYDEARAERAVGRAFDLALSYRSRVSRMYLYNFLGAPPDARWDSGLVRSDGAPRAGYFTARERMESPDFVP